MGDTDTLDNVMDWAFKKVITYGTIATVAVTLFSAYALVHRGLNSSSQNSSPQQNTQQYKECKKGIEDLTYEYKPFNQLEWETSYCFSNQIEINKLIEETVSGKLRDPELFREKLYSFADKLGYPAEKIKIISPLELTLLSVDITRRILDYEKVDDWGKWGHIYPVLATTDEYAADGIGDCDKYTSLLQVVFENLKKANTNTENVFMVNPGHGLGAAYPHSFATIMILGEDRIQYAHLDPTNLDDELELSQDALSYSGMASNDPSLNYHLAKFLELASFTDGPYINYGPEERAWNEMLKAFDAVESSNLPDDAKVNVYDSLTFFLPRSFENWFGDNPLREAEIRLQKFHNFMMTHPQFRYPESILTTRDDLNKVRSVYEKRHPETSIPSGYTNFDSRNPGYNTQDFNIDGERVRTRLPGSFSDYRGNVSPRGRAQMMQETDSEQIYLQTD